jgi:PAS domain S-box-containing protein
MKKLFYLGIDETTPRNIAQRIKLTNQICLLLLISNIGYIFIGLQTSNVLLAFIIVAYAIILSTLTLNHLKFSKLGRFTFSIYPSVVCGLAAAMLGDPSQPVPHASFALVLVGAIFPFIVFTYTEKIYVFVAFSICLVMVFGFEYFNRALSIQGIDYSMFNKPELGLFNIATCVLIIFACLNFLLNAERDTAQNNEKLINEINEKTAQISTSENELKNYIEQFNEAKIFEEQTNWQNIGATELAEVIRQNYGKEDIFKNVMSFIAKYTKALRGIIYIYSHGKNVLMYGAGYGVNQQEGVNHNMQLGEGLAGQCQKEKEIIHLIEIPSDYVEIRSGLGEAIPNTLILLPIKNDLAVEGVLELAFFNQLKPHEIDFLKKVSEILSSVIFNEKNNRRTNRILEQLQVSNNEIKAQEEELRQNLEELHTTQEEMRRAQIETEKKEAYLNALINNTTDSIIELDTDYRVLVINDTVLNRYKGTSYEGINVGVRVLDFMPEDLAKEWKAYYDRGLSGEQYKFTMPSTVNGENYIRHYNINPVKDKEGNIIGVSVFSRDIAEMKPSS